MGKMFGGLRKKSYLCIVIQKCRAKAIFDLVTLLTLKKIKV